MVCIVILSANGEKRILKTGLITGIPTGEAVAKAVRKTRPAEEITRYETSEGPVILWGWRDGKKGTENKSPLPSPLTLFGDIILTCITADKDMSLALWDSILMYKPDPAPAIVDYEKESDEAEDSDDDDEDEDEEDEEESSIESEPEEDEKESESEEEDESDVDDAGSCNDEEDGGGKRRAPRRRTAILEEFRRIEMGVRSRVQFPIPPTKRAPRWQTAATLEKDDITDDPIRIMILNLLTKRLASQLTDEQNISIESGIFQAALQDAEENGIRPNWENPAFVEIYKIIARRVIANLDPDSYIGNKRLIIRLKDGEFPPQQVAFMTPRELFPEHWQELADEQLKRETTMLEGNQGEGCDLFKCRRCGKSRTRYWEMQTRSADEPMTVFIRCLNCGKEWRQ